MSGPDVVTHPRHETTTVSAAPCTPEDTMLNDLIHQFDVFAVQHPVLATIIVIIVIVKLLD
jgi:hypothetical protein